MVDKFIKENEKYEQNESNDEKGTAILPVLATSNKL